jgi:hypothetical protein
MADRVPISSSATSIGHLSEALVEGWRGGTLQRVRRPSSRASFSKVFTEHSKDTAVELGSLDDAS